MTELTVDASIRSPYPVNPRLYGKFCEHLGANIYHGMEAQILFNCTFGKWQFSAGDGHPDGGICEESDRGWIAQRIENRAQRSAWPSAVPVQKAYFEGGAYGWFQVGGSEDVRLSPDVGPRGGRAQRVQVLPAFDGTARGIGQWTYLPLHRTRQYEFRIVARATQPCVLDLCIAPAGGQGAAGTTRIAIGCDWQTITGRIDLPEGSPAEALYRFALTATAPAHFVLDRVLLYPSDHIGGADPDVIHMLQDARLPLLRWPGGNFVSGYHWRHGVGPIDTRPTVPNPDLYSSGRLCGDADALCHSQPRGRPAQGARASLRQSGALRARVGQCDGRRNARCRTSILRDLFDTTLFRPHPTAQTSAGCGCHGRALDNQ